MITRRNILKGLGGALIAAPFVAKAGVLMPVRSLVAPDSISLAEIQRIKGEILSNAVPTQVINGKEYYVAASITPVDFQFENVNVFDPATQKHRPETATFRRWMPFTDDVGGN